MTEKRSFDKNLELFGLTTDWTTAARAMIVRDMT